MRLIDGDYLYNKLVANKCPYDLVLQMVKDEPTVCDIDAIKKRIKYETNKFDIKKGFAYCSGWFDGLMFANDIINEYTKE